MKHQWMMIAAIVLTGAPVIAGETFEAQGQAVVGWIADGDTMRVERIDPEIYNRIRQEAEAEQRRVDRDLRVDERFRDSERSMLVRIGNIDTPESVHPDPSRNTPEGKAASEYVKDLMADRTVNFVCWDIGHWGRPICSLYGGEMGEGFDLGVHLVNEGHAEYIDNFGPHPYWPEAYEEAAGSQQ
ncbi:nuclease (SNase domain protein) (plasmid) [Thioalkalivibrio sp. K90mix]|uniref:thermonuclease family protein n=1 Tax=Thioalkalivibrio sp. (strain K90mix) TaxID=396595 RepID=UPI000195A694|nr:thermonuclease family protein [Thioalkalivibrio sp. K90mix]ADC73271.1 nuclease (SNase domain protein) [Thioalkalivibrio sp. K90mix]